MRAPALALLPVVLAGCGLEAAFANIGHQQNDRPASKIIGTLQFPGSTLTVLDANGNVLKPFLPGYDDTLGGTVTDAGTFELRLPSSDYSNLMLKATTGNTALLALVPAVGAESQITGVAVDERSTAEALISLARLSADGSGWKAVSPSVYAAGTSRLIQAAFDRSGPTADFLAEVHRLVAAGRTASGPAVFFTPPAFEADGGVATSPIDRAWLAAHPVDYVGDGTPRSTSADFDQKLFQVAQLYKPAGCLDPAFVRTIFTVDFNAGRPDGNCNVINRFKWATDKPGKAMYFVGWIHKDSPIQDSNLNALLGAGVPNQLPMHDDGLAGDEVAGDNVYTIYFDLPKHLRVGYKFTWGFRGANWTGSEEWPGNSRIIQIEDLNGDNFVYRRDYFGDEATNKDRSNLNGASTAVLGWDDVLRPGWGIEARELELDTNLDCKPEVWPTIKSVGPYTVACTQ